MTITQVAVVGCGYWGPNLIRNLTRLSTAHLRALCDLDADKLANMASQHKPDYSTQNYDDLLNDDQIEAIVVATSAATHYELAKAALQAGKHVMVEKPIALKSSEAQDLIDVAAQKDLRLMVGHTFQYNPSVIYLRDVIQKGEIGDIVYAYMTRVNLGKIRDDLNVMWNLAPHDVSILLWTFESLPMRVSARGFSPLRPESEQLEDIVFILLEFANGAIAHIHNSWLDPNKVRRATFVGTQKMIVYDDVDTQHKIKIYDKGVDKIENPSSFGEFQLTIRNGDIEIPQLPTTEPLKIEMEHFIHCVQTGKTPLSDGVNGYQVLRVLEAADESIKNQGKMIELNW